MSTTTPMRPALLLASAAVLLLVTGGDALRLRVASSTPGGASALRRRRALAAQMQFGKGWAAAKKEREARESAEFKARAQREEEERQRREREALKEMEERAEARAEQERKMMEYQDNVDFMRPGGVMRQPSQQLTKADLENSRVTTSPVIDAENRLQEAAARAGTLGSAQEAMAMLERVIGEAYTAGVPIDSPQMKAAASLLGAFESAVESQAKAPAPKADKAQAAMDAIFADEYTIAGMDELDDDDDDDDD